ncbi:MAG: type II secretion system F family protein [Acidimicrobiales bacterium]
MRRLVATLATALVALVGLLVGVVPAAGQDSPALGVRDIDATDQDAVEVTFFYAGDRADLTGLTVREGGDQVESTTAVPLDDQETLGVVLVIDASGSMEEGALIERVKEAASAFVATKAPTDQIAVVSFAREVRVEQDFTTDVDLLNEAIEGIALTDDTSLYDGIIRASALFADTTLQPNLVVFSDGGDTTSAGSRDQAQASVERIGGALFAVGVDNPGFAGLADIAGASGGTSAVADSADVGGLFEAVQATLRKQYVVTFESRLEQGTAEIQLTVGGDSATAEMVAGSAQEGAASVQPQVVAKPSGPGVFRSSTGLLIGLGLLAAAIVAAVYSVGSSFFGSDNSLGSVLSPYSEGYVAAGDGDGDDGGDGRGQQYAQTALLQRAVQATGDFAQRQGFLTKIEGMLERANLPLRPPEALFFYAIGVVLTALVLLVVVEASVVALIGIVLVALVPPGILSYLANRRRKQFDSLLPDTLQLLASTLRAGYSLMQGVEAVSQEVSEPMGRELRRVVTEARLGRPLEESLKGIAERMESGDFAWAVMAIGIQREVGGNLAELLVTVADTMTERERLRRDVNALTAEGKISAIVLGILPLGLGFFIYTLNPGYMDPLFEETVGQIMLGGALLLAFFGFWWMKKTIEIDI